MDNKADIDFLVQNVAIFQRYPGNYMIMNHSLHKRRQKMNNLIEVEGLDAAAVVQCFSLN